MVFFVKYVVIDEGRNHVHIADFYFTMDIVLIDVFENYRGLFKKLSHFLLKKRSNIKYTDSFSFRNYFVYTFNLVLCSFFLLKLKL